MQNVDGSTSEKTMLSAEDHIEAVICLPLKTCSTETGCRLGCQLGCGTGYVTKIYQLYCRSSTAVDLLTAL
jgi:hypothetical protein